MKRSKKLLIMLAVCVVLIAGYLLVSYIVDKREAAEITASDTSVVVTNLNQKSIVSIHWQRNGEEYTITRADADSDWVLAQDPHFPFWQIKAGTMLRKSAAITASQAIYNVTDLSQYGLDKSGEVVTVTDAGGQATKLTIGGYNEFVNGYYILLNDDKTTVYVVDEYLYNAFNYDIMSLVEKEEIPSISNIYAYDVNIAGQQVEILCGQHEEDNSEYWYAAVSGMAVRLDDAKIAALAAYLSDFDWTACVNYRAGAEDLAVYGLASPSMAVSIKYLAGEKVDTGEVDENGNAVTETVAQEKEFTIQFGVKTEDGNIYASLPGSDMVYTIPTTIPDAIIALVSENSDEEGAQ